VSRDRDDHGADTILIVEDEDALREVTRRILARSGYQVLTAAGGAEAIDLAGRHDGEIHPPREAVLGGDVARPDHGDIRPVVSGFSGRPGLTGTERGPADRRGLFVSGARLY